MGLVDVIVVSFNSAEHLRTCVETIAATPGYSVVVVDNASSDGSLDSVRDLPLKAISLEENRGFAYANNVGLSHGSADHVLFLNPDAQISPESVERLARVLTTSERVGAVGPRIVDADGSLDFSLRRFPRVRSTFARALFLHRVFPTASWVDDVVRDETAYSSPRSIDWMSGACMLVRRDVLERIGGWDDAFFLYGEDIDLCARIWKEGLEVRFEPTAEAIHIGGASADRSSLAPLLTESRIRYVRKHRGDRAATLVRVGVALEALLRIAFGRGGWSARVGQARAVGAALSSKREPRAVVTSASSQGALRSAPHAVLTRISRRTIRR